MANPPVSRPKPTMPAFYPEATWVTLCERIITDAQIAGNATQFLSIYQALPVDIQQEFSSLLKSNAATTYADLLAGLRDRFKLPTSKKFEILYSIEHIGDRNPKHFLRHLRNKFKLANIDDAEQLKFAYARGMPQHYAVVALGTDAARIDEAANKLEDMYIFEQANKSQAVFNQVTASQYHNAASLDTSVNNPQICTQSSVSDMNIRQLISENTQLKDRLSSLEKEIAKLNVNSKGSYQNPRLPQYVPPHKRNSVVICHSIPSDTDRQGLCYSHLRFGDKAYNCQGSCSFTNMKSRKHTCTSPCAWSNFLARGINVPRRPAQKNWI